jgi:glutamine synthetase
MLECKPLNEIFGNRFVRLFASIKHHEYNTFLKVISAWEREHLLLNV